MSVVVDDKTEQRADDVIINGSTWAAIWHMSWPLMLNMCTISIASFADVWVAGKLGSDTQAAIGICGQIGFFMIMLAVALSAGTTALVSRFWGAGDFKGAVEAARYSLIFALIFGCVSGGIGLLVARPLVRMLGASPEVEEQGWQYLRLDLLSHIPFTVLWVSNSIFRAKGDARVPMMTWILMTTLICALDVGLCLGPFKMGIAGIGLAWLIAGTVGVLFSTFILSKSELKECLSLKGKLDKAQSKEWLGRLLRIGIPACIQDLSWVGGNFLLLFILSHTHDPTSAQAAWGVGLRVEEMIGGMPIYALSMAVGTIVGQNLGAKQPDRAVTAGWQVAGLGAALNFVVAVLLFTFAREVASVMSTDPKVIAYTSDYFRWVGICQPFVALWLILFGAMQGAGYTRWPMIASTIVLTLFRLPLAWYLSVNMNWGPTGTWAGVSVSVFIVGLLAIWRFNTGVWKDQKV
ncbi:MAG TPA: MATE family efflux transporter [Candidatus Melainabacteria bacterium]|nr:MATE family efflux transporter [Candidatus Melainabacteria bacterium]HIN63899.1 MATE family efflux transporter [Candidatus Obscuribacterales bacterium]